MPNNANDWNWVAGIFEGEGTASLRWAKKRHEGSARRAFLYAAISQTETSMLQEVLRIVGFGKIYNTNKKRAINHKQQFSWQVACAQARTFLQTLQPFLRSDHKKLQVMKALAMDKEMRIAGGKARRAALAKGSASRWERYRATISKKEASKTISQ